MLQCMDMKNWADGLRPGNYEKRISKNLANLEDCIKMIKLFEKVCYINFFFFCFECQKMKHYCSNKLSKNENHIYSIIQLI